MPQEEGSMVVNEPNQSAAGQLITRRTLDCQLGNWLVMHALTTSSQASGSSGLVRAK
jgi:hypothetical protein